MSALPGGSIDVDANLGSGDDERRRAIPEIIRPKRHPESLSRRQLSASAVNPACQWRSKALAKPARKISLGEHENQEAQGRTLAAVLLDPLPSRAGMIPVPAG